MYYTSLILLILGIRTTLQFSSTANNALDCSRLFSLSLTREMATIVSKFDVTTKRGREPSNDLFCTGSSDNSGRDGGKRNDENPSNNLQSTLIKASVSSKNGPNSPAIYADSPAQVSWATVR